MRKLKLPLCILLTFCIMVAVSPLGAAITTGEDAPFYMVDYGENPNTIYDYRYELFINENKPETAARWLYMLGLLRGQGTGADGWPLFALEKTPTRQEAVTMLVRLMGKEDEALSGSWRSTFTDLDDWAKPYVNYAYEMGYTKGYSNLTFGQNDPVTGAQYVTLVLRALGYEDGVTYIWDDPWEFAIEVGLCDDGYTPPTTYTRGDMAVLSYSALDVYTGSYYNTLYNRLDSAGDLKQPENLTDAMVLDVINSLRTEFYEGMRWTDDYCFVNNKTNYHWYCMGCAGIALVVQDYVFGPYTFGDRSQFGNLSGARVSDHLRINNDSHSVVFMGALGGYITVLEGNYNSSIHWGRRISSGSLDLDYVQSRYQ